MKTLVLLLVPVFMIFVSSIYAQEGNTTSDHVPKFFAIQHAQSGSLSEINETAYSLELKDISDKTILFSDRHDRIVKSLTTANFIGNWSERVDNFKIDPPNAVIIVNDSEGQQDSTIIELFNPVYDPNKRSLKYEVISYNTTFIELPSEFEQTTIVIDSRPSNFIPPEMVCYH